VELELLGHLIADECSAAAEDDEMRGGLPRSIEWLERAEDRIAALREAFEHLGEPVAELHEDAGWYPPDADDGPAS
jgi:hypothetical protein